MSNKVIKLWDKTPLFDNTIPQPEPTLTYYPAETPNDSCIIICPGGGYTMKAIDHEGVQIANWLNQAGINAFICDYRVSPYRAPCPLMDLRRSIRYIRHNAKEFGIDKNKIGILGFSAGGHLVSSAATHFDDIENGDEIDSESCRPDLVILCYPVITTTESFMHRGSMLNLLGNNASDEDALYYSSEKQVKPNSPPAFLWHTAADSGVPVKNTLEYAAACSAQKVPFEVHIFPEGPHGIGLAPAYPHAAQWAELCIKWLRTYNF